MRRAATWAAREWSGIPAASLRVEDVAKLVSKWETALATSTAYAYTRALTRILRYLERHHGAPPLADEKLPAPKYPGPRVQIASDEEIAAALRIASPAMKTVLLLCADCGLRSNEAVSIAPEHYSRETKILTWKVKGGWSRSLPVTERLAAWLAEAPEAGASVPFAEAFHGRGFSQERAHWHWRDIKHRAGIRPEIRLHDLRRTLATKAYRETKDLFAVQQLLGHHTLEATLKYIAPFDPPALRPLLEALKTPTERKEKK